MPAVTRTLFLSLLALIWYNSIAQPYVTGKIVDASNGAPIAYCGVGLLGSSKGCLSNEEGVFAIGAGWNDTLVFSILSYRKTKVPVSAILHNRIVALQPAAKLVEEISIHATDESAYLLLDRTRQALLKTTDRVAKSYYILGTRVGDQPVELLECYYTALLNENRVIALEFKNGRVGLAPINEGYFVSLDISGAFSLLDLLYPNERMPANPFQFSLKRLKKQYTAKLEESYDSLHPVQIVSFRPKDERAGFSGRAHILKNSSLPLRIELFVKNAAVHPFKPLFRNARILSADIAVNKVFEFMGDSLFTRHIDFDYSLNYALNSDERKVTSRGLMYFYDYHNPFLPILYPFDTDVSDYKRMSSLSYNEAFWDDNHVIEYSGATRKHLEYLISKGTTLNYRDAVKAEAGLYQADYFETSDRPWSKERRLSIHGDRFHTDTTQKMKTLDNNQFLVNSYCLKAGIYLDANPAKDGLQHKSVSVFNMQDSYFHRLTDTLTDCWLNIFFDLIEIERLKMEKEIAKNPHSWDHMKASYTTANKNIESTTHRYMTEVRRGLNSRKFKEWNKIVVQELGIDNIEIFKLKKVTEYDNTVPEGNRIYEFKKGEKAPAISRD